MLPTGSCTKPYVRRGLAKKAAPSGDSFAVCRRKGGGRCVGWRQQMLAFFRRHHQIFGIGLLKSNKSNENKSVCLSSNTEIVGDFPQLPKARKSRISSENRVFYQHYQSTEITVTHFNGLCDICITW